MIVIVIKYQKEQKAYVIKRRLKLNDYINCLLNNKPILKSYKDLKVKHIICLPKTLTRLR